MSFDIKPECAGCPFLEQDKKLSDRYNALWQDASASELQMFDALEYPGVSDVLDTDAMRAEIAGQGLAVSFSDARDKTDRMAMEFQANCHGTIRGGIVSRFLGRKACGHWQRNS